MPHILIRDVTLREGSEVPGVRLTVDQQVEIAQALAGVGVRFIEVAGPATTKQGLELVLAMQQAGLTLRPAFLLTLFDPELKSRADQIRSSCGGGEMIEVLVPVSGVRLAALGCARGEVPLVFAKRWQPFSQDSFSTSLGFVDATRADVDVIVEIIRMAGNAVDHLTLYDTVGVGTPERMRELVSRLQAAAGQLPIWVHCHNDHGLATANTLAAVAAGATGVDLSVNGLGDRSGNAALEEVVVGLERLYGVATGIDLAQLTTLSQLVESLTGVPTSPLKPIVGRYAFTHAAPSHRSLVREHPEVFEPFNPSLVGGTREILEG